MRKDGGISGRYNEHAIDALARLKAMAEVPEHL